MSRIAGFEFPSVPEDASILVTGPRLLVHLACIPDFEPDHVVVSRRTGAGEAAQDPALEGEHRRHLAGLAPSEVAATRSILWTQAVEVGIGEQVSVGDLPGDDVEIGHRRLVAGLGEAKVHDAVLPRRRTQGAWPSFFRPAGREVRRRHHRYRSAARGSADQRRLSAVCSARFPVGTYRH